MDLDSEEQVDPECGASLSAYQAGRGARLTNLGTFQLKGFPSYIIPLSLHVPYSPALFVQSFINSYQLHWPASPISQFPLRDV